MIISLQISVKLHIRFLLFNMFITCSSWRMCAPCYHGNPFVFHGCCPWESMGIFMWFYKKNFFNVSPCHLTNNLVCHHINVTDKIIINFITIFSQFGFLNLFKSIKANRHLKPLKNIAMKNVKYQRTIFVSGLIWK